MNILILGSGGREHAFAWKLVQSPHCEHLFIAPGNAGTALCGTNVDISGTNFNALKSFCIDNDIKMLVVGPEEPLVKGIYDSFTTDNDTKHIAVIGPSQNGAKLEGSKAFAKAFMYRHNIPTARYKTFDKETIQSALEFVSVMNPPVVIKADGLAAGKGVVITNTSEEAREVLHGFMLNDALGVAGETVVIEEFLDGIEFSVFVITDGEHYKLFPIAKDYKRIGDGDIGPNTGGMGAVSPVPFVTEELLEKVRLKVIEPTLKGIKSEKVIYKGFIYIGLIYVQGEPFVIEYNCRMGDPETEVVLPRVKNDLVELFMHIHKGTLNETDIIVDTRSAITIVASSEGYPGSYPKGRPIAGLEKNEEVFVFQSGVLKNEGAYLTNGGRVLCVTALGKTAAEARIEAYNRLKSIDFEGMYYRRDIGLDLLND